uniref:Uncharacterized protein n=1 Tax=Caenorhabditis japonica TaxID=281687 RepID=A0A8R1ENR3_CAEJA
MTSENGRSGVDNVAQQAAVNKLVAPKVTKYYSVGMSVTGPIKRVLRNTIEATNERLKESNELINTCAENSTPKGDAELDDLLRHRESLKKALIDLQYLPIFVESKLEIPQFLQEPNADTHSIEMRQLLVDSEVDHKMSVVRSTIGMIETELTAKGKTFSIEAVEHDPFEDSFKRAEEMNEKKLKKLC